MHSWVFRHRARLRAIYGPVPPLPLQGPGEAYEPLAALPAAEPEWVEVEAFPVPESAGSIERGDSFVLLHPMPRERSA